MSPPSPEPAWQRLDARMIWVDALQTALSLLPAALAIWVFGVEPELGSLWPLLLVAVWGTLGAGADALRWLKTRYRITDEYVERRTGLLFRAHRSIRRDRIRSVDITAQLRHRLAGLRVVTIGAGQQASAGEAALTLNSISRAMAQRLARELPAGTGTATPAAGPAEDTAAAPPPAAPVLAQLRWSWIVYNLFNIWAYLGAAGVLWAAVWITGGLGFDLAGFLLNLVDWERLGWGWSTLIGVLGVGALGVAVMAVAFVTEFWGFRLTRETGEHGTVLRTSQGLFKTRQIDRDEERLRGVEISEPVLWRWMGVADTNVITTGLSDWSLSPASTILPRGPIRVARQVSRQVLRTPGNPLTVALAPHPRAALYLQLWQALVGCALITAGVAWLAQLVSWMPAWAPLAALGLVPISLLAAVVTYRALGHALVGDYLVVRSGLPARATAALQTRAVVGWSIRQSLLQRRLGLATLTATTAAGSGYYQAIHLPAGEAAQLAAQAVPELLTPFLREAPPARADRTEELVNG